MPKNVVWPDRSEVQNCAYCLHKSPRLFAATQKLLNGFLCLKAGNNPGHKDMSFVDHQ